MKTKNGFCWSVVPIPSWWPGDRMGYAISQNGAVNGQDCVITDSLDDAITAVCWLNALDQDYPSWMPR